jgi:hypothetical protein
MERLAKLEQFRDAHNIQQKIYQLEQVEFQQHKIERDKKLNNLMEKKIT